MSLPEATSLSEVIDATRDAVADDVGAAAVTFRVTNSLVPGTATQVSVEARAHGFAVDEPVSLGGTDLAPNPVEYALAALGSCQVITYQFWAARLGIRLDSVSVAVEGDLDVRGFFGIADHVRPGFSAIRVAVSLTGPESRERYEELRWNVDRHCPVLDLFRAETPTRTTLAA
ncbi:OsmC family protein [Allokutzneria oryzae]|uniref:OsmC family protein n=1 Tax=Allokutzneria oryzae TaxID=1378989 RepID=A0ABV6A5L5_9PSEU